MKQKVECVEIREFKPLDAAAVDEARGVAEGDGQAVTLPKASNAIRGSVNQIAESLNELEDGMDVAFSVASHVSKLERMSSQLAKLKDNNQFSYSKGGKSITGPDAASEFGALVSTLKTTAEDLFQTRVADVLDGAQATNVLAVVLAVEEEAGEGVCVCVCVW